ncbi:GNAT family N-acetyltransferase [Microbacterium sp. NPDC019599]|uniref:GNAT family N-acetyltransferase n=1 Tax=Microbacterium sp. NPDC019599 TaxID=3154690 RepID=UPI0033E169CE
MSSPPRLDLTLVPWTDADIAVLERANSPAMTRFLGGVESADDLAERHRQYLGFAETGGGAMFRVEVDGETAGYAGWWSEVHEGEPVFEIGCAVQPEWQGRGVATEALRRVVALARETEPRPVVGYGAVGNAASRALCLRVGFEHRGTGIFPGDDGDVEVDIWVIGG